MSSNIIWQETDKVREQKRWLQIHTAKTKKESNSLLFYDPAKNQLLLQVLSSSSLSSSSSSSASERNIRTHTQLAIAELFFRFPKCVNAFWQFSLLCALLAIARMRQTHTVHSDTVWTSPNVSINTGRLDKKFIVCCISLARRGNYGNIYLKVRTCKTCTCSHTWSIDD